MSEGKDPRAAANHFISRGIAETKPITPMEVQKLLFFAHGWMLGLHGQPLHYDEWEAWRFGPVLPVIYHNLSYYGGEPVANKVLALPTEFDPVEQGVMDQVYEKYRPMGARRLSALTHLKGSPWDQVKRQRFGDGVISNDRIRSYFRKLARKIEAMNG